MGLNPKTWFKHKKSIEAKSLSIDDPRLIATDSYTQTKAFKISAYYGCVQDKAQSIGQIPIRLYRRLDDGTRVEVNSGRMARIFSKDPCDYLDIQGFLEMMVASLESIGAFYAYKERNDRGNIMAIIPFKNQDNVNPSMDVNGNVYYTYTTNDGQIRDPYAVEDLLIINKLTLDGYTPLRPIAYMATLLGIASAQDETYKEQQENGITANMGLSTEKTFNDLETIKRLKADWGPNGKFRGPNGKRNVPIFDQGLKPVNLNLTPSDSELLTNREFTVKQISMMTGVPLYRIGLSNSAITKGLLPELDESYMRNNLNPILVKFENAWNKLLPDDMYVEFNRKAFYNGSPWRLVEYVEKEVKGGLATINEGREDLGREPVDGGDVFAIDNNNVTYGTWPELPNVREQIYNRTAGTQQTEEGTEDED